MKSETCLPAAGKPAYPAGKPAYTAGKPDCGWQAGVKNEKHEGITFGETVRAAAALEGLKVRKSKIQDLSSVGRQAGLPPCSPVSRPGRPVSCWLPGRPVSCWSPDRCKIQDLSSVGRQAGGRQVQRLRLRLRLRLLGCKADIIIRYCAKSRMLKFRILAETPTEEIGVAFLFGADCLSVG